MRVLSTLIVVVMLAASTIADAASLRICFDDASLNADVAKVRVDAGTDPLYADILAGSTLSGVKRCNTQPVPAAMVRGVNVSITLRGINAFEEVGPASNAIAFRPPLTPPSLTGATLSVVVP